MIKNSTAFILYFFLTINQVFSQVNLDNAIDKGLNDLVTTYKTMHASPELSGHEEKTSAFISAQLKALGYNVTENVGRYKNRNWKGYGVTGIMKNGSGLTVLVRTD